MKNLYLLFLLFVFGSVVLSAQDKKVLLAGNVYDRFTGQKIDSVQVRLLHRNDSSEIQVSLAYIRKEEPNALMFVVPVTETGDYLVHFSRNGYTDEYLPFEVTSFRQQLYVEYVKLRKERVLPAATVAATKVKMVFKGDTIVYNADAFQLAEGSMLDALVAQLPGVQLSGGRITVNGEFVSSLLINGKDFFNGNAKIALDNLPSYIVNKIKVYKREHESAYITGPSSETEKPLVMDVNLKKQYAIGFIANMEGGGGTDERYLARLFALRYTGQSRLSIYGNITNTGDMARPNENNEWKPSDAMYGMRHAKYGGADFALDDKEGRWKFPQTHLSSMRGSQTNGALPAYVSSSPEIPIAAVPILSCNTTPSPRAVWEETGNSPSYIPTSRQESRIMARTTTLSGVSRTSAGNRTKAISMLRSTACILALPARNSAAT